MTNHREAKSVDWCCYLRRQLLYLLPVFACRKPGLMSCIWCSQFGGPLFSGVASLFICVATLVVALRTKPYAGEARVCILYFVY